MKKRLFIALPLPYGFHDTLSGLQDKIRHLGKMKLVEPDNVHLTLKFLGNVEVDKIPDIEKALAPIREYKKFELRVYGLGAFPNNKRPRVIWLGVEKGVDEIASIHEKISSEMIKVGFTADKRFHPHYTLARVKYLNNKLGLREILVKNREQVFGEYTVERITLMESHLSPKGPAYTVLGDFRLS
ncbi:MAG: RNA 2',3'-cyclic phosphodiesterase [Candidatus Altiarchaeales archaeon ex4484_96]|nr:MAG: RNA 2',3'-cyclic phosphodiesterase [Candidatus Altiarchaeales archaeon ex4484_96]